MYLNIFFLRIKRAEFMKTVSNYPTLDFNLTLMIYPNNLIRYSFDEVKNIQFMSHFEVT